MGLMKLIVAHGDVIKEKRIENPHYFIMLHDNDFRVSWDIFMLTLLGYVLLVAPFRLGFDYSAEGTIYYFELCIDFCFILDILIQFRTSYISDEGKPVLEWKKIAWRYFKGFFLIDVVSSIPWDLFLKPDQNDAATSARFLKTVRLVKISKLGRIGKLKKFFVSFQEYYPMDSETVHVYSALGTLFLTSHFLACLWAFAGRYGTSDDLFASNSWQARYGILFADSRLGRNDEYLYALYWAVTSITTVGYGDVVPKTQLEMISATVAMMVGVSFYGFLTAVLTAYFLSTDPQLEIVNQSMKMLRSYLDGNHYPRGLRREIKAFFYSPLRKFKHF